MDLSDEGHWARWVVCHSFFQVGRSNAGRHSHLRATAVRGSGFLRIAAWILLWDRMSRAITQRLWAFSNLSIPLLPRARPRGSSKRTRSLLFVWSLGGAVPTTTGPAEGHIYFSESRKIGRTPANPVSRISASMPRYMPSTPPYPSASRSALFLFRDLRHQRFGGQHQGRDRAVFRNAVRTLTKRAASQPPLKLSLNKRLGSHLTIQVSRSRSAMSRPNAFAFVTLGVAPVRFELTTSKVRT
jgi:hypothetical protein